MISPKIPVLLPVILLASGAISSTISQANTNDTGNNLSNEIQIIGCKDKCGDVPDPENCHFYYTCVHGEVSEQRPCAGGPDGSYLYYDFRNCKCDWSSQGCFNVSDNPDFHICTVPIDQCDLVEDNKK